MDFIENNKSTITNNVSFLFKYKFQESTFWLQIIFWLQYNYKMLSENYYEFFFFLELIISDSLNDLLTRSDRVNPKSEVKLGSMLDNVFTSAMAL